MTLGARIILMITIGSFIFSTAGPKLGLSDLESLVVALITILLLIFLIPLFREAREEKYIIIGNRKISAPLLAFSIFGLMVLAVDVFDFLPEPLSSAGVFPWVFLIYWPLTLFFKVEYKEDEERKQNMKWRRTWRS
ncbi:hypothetical protein [Lihuaxuella thermophila]|uniref:Uncharacterized protein n=1 Tax=Lihuaxuella thermophila TaxID=1173111 RepID=A0A1H8ARK9_9BACL|nr:hypothetical protein [Lihuaxuella thermophila]SEM72449.1 hypothetical protein SAMN05444955_101272 [Lihuaxuella thermophila]